MWVPMLFERVQRQGRAGLFQVSRVDLVRQIADLVPLGAGYCMERDVPFSVLAGAPEEEPAEAKQCTGRQSGAHRGRL